MYTAANMRGLAFYISGAIERLVSHVKELAIDATFGTNNMGMDLYAVLAEVDGTGVPLAYCFIHIFRDNCKGKRTADPGATIDLLCQFLRPLQAAGLEPSFFGEIFAIRSVWPNTTI
jgi:hypothetical protein